jgi:hypothetical protein
LLWAKPDGFQNKTKAPHEARIRFTREAVMLGMHVFRVFAKQILAALFVEHAPRVRVIVESLKLSSLCRVLAGNNHFDFLVLRVSLPSEVESETLILTQ